MPTVVEDVSQKAEEGQRLQLVIGMTRMKLDKVPSTTRIAPLERNGTFLTGPGIGHTLMEYYFQHFPEQWIGAVHTYVRSYQNEPPWHPWWLSPFLPSEHFRAGLLVFA